VLDVIHALRQLLSGRAEILDPEIFPAGTLTRWSTTGVQVFEMDVDLCGDVVTYRLEIEHIEEIRGARICLERLSAEAKPLFESRGDEVTLYRDDHTAGPTFPADYFAASALARTPARKENQRVTRFLEHMRKTVICGLYPRGFAAESSSEDALLARDGSNFAGWYRHIFQEHQELMPDYLEALRDVIDGFQGIRLEKVGSDTRAFQTIFAQHGKRFELRLSELSDGQRALIALYALVHLTAGQGYSLFLDEPDNYLALPEIQPWLIALSDACGDTLSQAVLCSHHPELIDYLGGDRGLLMARETSGVVVTKRPSTDGLEGGLKLSELIARGWER